MLRKGKNVEFDNSRYRCNLIEISDKQSEKGDRMHQKIISSEDNVAITSITMYEALYGLMKYTKPFHHLFSFHVSMHLVTKMLNKPRYWE